MLVAQVVDLILHPAHRLQQGLFRRLDSTVSLADPGRPGVLDLALVALDVLGGAGGGNGGALVVGRAPDAGCRAAALAVEPAGVIGAGGGAVAPATISLDSLFAMTGAPN